MFKDKKSLFITLKSIPKLLGIFLITGIALLVVYLTQVPSNRIKKDQFQKKYQVLNSYLEDLWVDGNYGDIPKSCDSLRFTEALVHSDFYKCNPLLLKCFFENSKKIEIKKLKFDFDSFTFDRRLRPIVRLKQGQQSYSLKMNYSCTDTYLPQKFYSAGSKNQNFRWDNFYQDVYIDKNYISNLMVGLWNKKKYEDLYKPNTSLTLNEKKNYCQTLGKQLLESRYLDAASYYPEQKEGYFYKHPYPWTKQRPRLKEKIKKSDCANIYSKECESIRPYQFYEPLSITWMGISNALGNYPEVIENKFIKGQNLMPSSFNYLWNDKRNRIGVREPLKSKGAFRCMLVR